MPGAHVGSGGVGSDELLSVEAGLEAVSAHPPPKQQRFTSKYSSRAFRHWLSVFTDVTSFSLRKHLLEALHS